MRKGRPLADERSAPSQEAPNVFTGLRRGDPDAEPERQAPAADHFMRTGAVLEDPELRYTGSGEEFFLGGIGSRLIGYRDDRHLMTVAGSRSGKSTAVLIPNLIGYRGSVLAIDPKGELATRTARRRAHGRPVNGEVADDAGLGQTVYVLDPFQKSKVPDPAPGVICPARFNPMEHLRESSPSIVEDAALIADALVVPNEDEPHWDESARTLLECLLLHVATRPGYLPMHRNLGEVRDLLLALSPGGGDEAAQGHQELEKELEGNAALGGLIQRLARDFLDRPAREAGSVLSTARRHTKFLDIPAIRSMLTPVRSHFSMRELKTAPGGVTIYLCLPPSMLSICRGWLRLFVNMTLSEIERATVGDDGDIGRTQTGLPVLLCLDEFASLGYMRQLEAASAYVAGYGALLWVVLQDLSQLQRHYRSSWETFIGNAGMLQFFGTMDLTTQKYVSERLGTTRVALRSRDYTPGGERNQSPAPRKSLSFAEHPVLTPAEVGRLTRRSDPLRRQIVFVQEQPAPLLLQRVDYYRSGSGDIFAGRFDGPGGTEYGG